MEGKKMLAERQRAVKLKLLQGGKMDRKDNDPFQLKVRRPKHQPTRPPWNMFEYPPLRSSYETHAYVHIHFRNSQPVITVLHAYSIYCTERACSAHCSLFSAFFSFLC